VDALLVKMVCAVAGFVLAFVHGRNGSAWPEDQRLLAWRVSFAFGVLALGSAAFLRWFS
jgi:hypothetical protein